MHARIRSYRAHTELEIGWTACAVGPSRRACPVRAAARPAALVSVRVPAGDRAPARRQRVVRHSALRVFPVFTQRVSYEQNKQKRSLKTLVPARRGRFPPAPPVGLLRPPNVETCICVLLTFYIPTRSLDPLALPFGHAARPVHPTSFHSRASGPVFISSRIFHTRHWSNRSARTVLIRTRHSE